MQTIPPPDTATAAVKHINHTTQMHARKHKNKVDERGESDAAHNYTQTDTKAVTPTHNISSESRAELIRGGHNKRVGTAAMRCGAVERVMRRVLETCWDESDFA